MQSTSPWYRPDEGTTAHDVQSVVRTVFYAAMLYVTITSIISILDTIAGF